MPPLRSHRRVAPLLGALVLLCCWYGLPAPARAQAHADPRTSELADAVRLRDAGDLAGAVRLLQPHLARYPTDAAARLALAEILYWMRDVGAARQLYQEGLTMHPSDPALRLAYGRLLVETGDRRLARATLEPLSDVAPVRAQSLTLLGTLAYWSGDLATASRHFGEALRTDPGQAEARRQLREIATATAPWITVGGELRRDDQPLDVTAAELQAGWFTSPLLSVTGRVRSARHAPTAEPVAGVTAADVGISHFAPRLRLETELVGGTVQRMSGAAVDWTARAGAGLRLPARVTVRLRAARAPYLYTTASLTTPVMTQTIGGTLQWSHPRGWLAEAAGQHERYPDANTVRTGHAWLLAPVARGRAGELQLGYGISAQDAEESRFVRAPRGRSDGRYDPYYTPERLRSQSVLAAAVVRPSGRLELRAGGAYGITASEDAPVHPLGPGGPSFVARTFTPWNARGSATAHVADGLRLTASGEHGRTAFYAWTTASLQLSYRFTAGALRRVP